MATDPDLDWILADLNANLPPGESFTLFSGTESCVALYDDGETVQLDSGNAEVLTLGTVLRYRDGAITRPAVGATVTLRRGEDVADETFKVRETARDPANPGVIRLTVARS